MRLGDSTEEAEFRAGLREWLHANVGPTDPATPRRWTSEEMRAWSKSLHESGYAGLNWPIADGGRGLSTAYQAIFAEESALAEAPDHVNVIGLNMVGPAIIRHGTPEQRARFLERILSGDALFCQGFSEPDAGSDLASIRTRAVEHPDGYQLDGEKVWSSYAHLADYCLVLARTDSSAAKYHGLTCFLVDMRTPGVHVRPLRQISGDSDFNQITFLGAVTPADSVLGPVGDGWRVAMTTLAHERGTFGITLTARLAVQFDRLVRTAKVVRGGRDPVVRREIADLWVRLQGLRYTGYRALASFERTGEPGPESSLIKLRWSQADQQLSALALRLLGGQGAITGTSAFWSGYWQHRRLHSAGATIEGGTSEILQSIIAERVLGLPRSR